MKMKIFSVLLFLGLVFVVPIVSAKASSGRFSEGDSDPPVFCRQVQDPNLALAKKRSGFSATNLSSPAAREYEDATGEQNILVVLAAFADQNANEDTSELEEKVKEAFFGEEGSESVAEYLEDVSQGKMLLKGDILSGWKILKNSEEYWSGEDLSSLNYNKVLNDTIAAIDDEVYFPDYGRIIIFLKDGEKRDYASGSIGKWDEIESDDGLLSIGICWLWESTLSYKDDLRHELLHTYGFSHSGTIYLKDEDACDRLCANQEITKSDDTTWPPLECSTEEYGDGMCVLGHGRGYPSAFIRLKMGCLNDDQILVITESANVTLIPRASSLEGIKMIIIKAKDSDGKTKTYFLEFFKRLPGFDTRKSGPKILVRFFNEEERLNDSGTILLLKKNEADIEDIYYESLDLKEEPFCDSENGIEVKWVSEQGEEMIEEGSYAELQITLSCEEKSPAVSVSPDYIQTMSGENVMTEISVTNEMAALGCGTRTVNVEASLPDANWSATFSPSSTLELGPGESGTITAVIWVPETAAAGSYGATFKATDQDSGLSGEASATIEVLRPIPTPSPVPTPIPTPNEEMILSVTINGQDATTNNIVVARKNWVEVRAEVSEPGGKMLQADKISCALTKSNGKIVYRNNANGTFRFKVGRRGKYSLEIEAFKNGFQAASFQTSFKVR